MAERIFRMAVALFVGVYVARYLGPERFGELSYVASFAGLFSALAMLGLDGIVVRELVKDESRRDELLGTAFWLKAGGAVVTLALLSIVLMYAGGTREEKILVLIIATGFLFQSTNVIDFYFQARVQSKFVVHAQIAQVILSSITKIILVLLGAPLVWFAVVMAADSLVLGIFLIISYTKRKKLSIHTWCFRWTTALSILKDSWPLILSGIAVSIYMKIDQVMIRNMLDTEAVGNYAAAVKLSEAWYFVPTAITSSVFPAIINAKKTSEDFYYLRLQQLYDLMVWLAVAIALPMTFLSDWIMNILFGSQYNQAGAVLAVHIWAGVFVFLGVANGKSITVENKQIQSMIRTTIGSISNVTLNWILIPLMGITGAAIATIISYAISAYISIPFFHGQYRNFTIATKSLIPFIRYRHVNR